MADVTEHTLLDEEEDGDYIDIEDSDSEELDSDDSDEDPTFDVFEETHSKLSQLSIEKKSKSRLCRNGKEKEMDEEDEDLMDVSEPKLNAEDMKSFEQVERMINAGQVEKLKVEQCKVYLRKHGLRLTGKKEMLIQRIREHLEILENGGEKKYPPSSFVLNCKGDACMGDIVMFEQNVYEGFSIASRSATGPPCGRRIVVGRIVKESYGAAKQQHTFTVEVLWSKGDKPLPPLHPLLIKGRNLYKLNTVRQRWEDEAERQRVLGEKHSRGSLARSSREVRIKHKEAKKTLKASRVSKKEESKPYQQPKIVRNVMHNPPRIAPEKPSTHAQQPPQVVRNTMHNPPRTAPEKPSTHTQRPLQPNIHRHHSSVGHPYSYERKSQPSFDFIREGSSHSSLYGSPTYQNPNRPMPPFQPMSYHRPPLSTINYDVPYREVLRVGNTRRQYCRYFAQGRCYYGDRCKYSHV